MFPVMGCVMETQLLPELAERLLILIHGTQRLLTQIKWLQIYARELTLQQLLMPTDAAR